MNTQPDNQEAECTQAAEALSAYFDGVANNAEKKLATAHLAQCSSCTQMWREWQGLRLMAQRALEPTASGEMLPLASVKVPRHLKAAILRQTSRLPLWQRYWPRLLTGMAVPTAAVTCWLIIVAAPWQQPLPQINVPASSVSENRAITIPDKSVPLSVTPEKSLTVIPAKSKIAPSIKKIAPSIKTTTSSINKSQPSRSSHQTESRPVSVAPISRTTQAARVRQTSSSRPTKSTFNEKTQQEIKNRAPEAQLKTPRISMASMEPPHSRTAEPISAAVQPIPTITTSPRATEIVLVAEIPDHDMGRPTEDVSNPVLEYIAKNDVRPDDIRLAVENYRAALLDVASDL